MSIGMTRVTDVTYSLDDTKYRIIVTADVIAAPHQCWSDCNYGNRYPLSDEWMANRLHGHKIRGADKRNLVRCIRAAVEKHNRKGASE